MRIPLLILALCLALPAAADASSIVGIWHVISWTGDRPEGDEIEIRQGANGYEVVAGGTAYPGYSGSPTRAERRSITSLQGMREDHPQVPDAVLRQLQGRYYHRLTFELSADGMQLVETQNESNITWTGDRLDAFDPEARVARVVYQRAGSASAIAASSAIRIGALETGVYSCSLVDPKSSGCLELRNDSDRRVRLYMDVAAGVVCTADPHVWCGVALPVGEYRIRLVPDDEQGVGPELAGRITVSPTGTRIRIAGD